VAQTSRAGGAGPLDYLPFSFVLSLGLVLDDDDEEGVDDEDDELGGMALDGELGDIELDEDELGGIELDDDAVELGVDDVSLEDDVLEEVLGGLAGGVVVLDELDVDGGVAGVVVSLRCWQPTSAATTAAAAAVIMKRFIDGSFGQMRVGATASIGLADLMPVRPRANGGVQCPSPPRDIILTSAPALAFPAIADCDARAWRD
jgi:hypothetical protein